MSETKQDKTGSMSLFEAWMRSSADMLDSSLKIWQSAFPGGEDGESAAEQRRNRAREQWETTLNTWKAAVHAMREPEAVEGLFKGINTMPEILLKMVQPALNGVFHMQQEALKRAMRIGKSTQAYNFENLDQEAFKAWTEIYEKEFRQFLSMPQLGLTREYQERVSVALDKYNVLQGTVAEFLALLLLPVEKSYKVMQEKVAEMADKGKLPDNAKDYYRMWVKTLEGHYMTLYKSPEYTETIGKTIDAVGEFSVAKRKILEDFMQVLPVPTYKEMDELFKEIYRLKKRIRELEKQNKTGGNQAEK